MTNMAAGLFLPCSCLSGFSVHIFRSLYLSHKEFSQLITWGRVQAFVDFLRSYVGITLGKSVSAFLAVKPSANSSQRANVTLPFVQWEQVRNIPMIGFLGLAVCVDIVGQIRHRSLKKVNHMAHLCGYTLGILVAENFKHGASVP